MGMTFAQKALAKAAGVRTASQGDIVVANVDVAMMDDILGPRIEIADGLTELGASIFDKAKVVVISDHYTPPCDVNQAEAVHFTKKWSLKNGVRYFEYEGPCHQVLAEYGYDLPGQLVVGTDSHTCTSGAFGAFGTGIGSTEMLGVLVLGSLWLKVPESFNIQWNNDLSLGVYAKDMVLYDCREIGHSGATYKALEYSGSTLSTLSMDERMCISNMGVEMGAKISYIPYDEKTQSFYEEHGITYNGIPLFPDVDAKYEKTFVRDASKLVPQVACPHNVDNVFDVDQVEGEELTQMFIGSCTGGRLSDLHVAAKILKNQHIKESKRLLITPASKRVYHEAIEDGTLEILCNAGAVVTAPSCGLCLGAHTGILAAGESCISSSNRNFVGRMGSPKSSVYLASAATVAASAIEGKITDPRKFL